MANSVYIAIEADTKHFQAALEEIKKQSGIVGGVAAQNFQSSFGSSIRNLSKDFSTAFNSLKMAKIDLPVDSVKAFAKEIGMAENQFKQYAERMAKNTAFKNAENSFKRIAQAANLNNREMKNLAQQMGFTSEEIKKLIKNSNASGKTLGSLSANWAKVVAGFYVAEKAFNTVAKVVKFVAESLENLAEKGRMAANLGLDTETFTRLSYIAKSSGVDINNFAKQWKTLQKTISEASFGSSEKLEVFSRLGVDLRELKALSPERQMAKIADSIKSLNNEDKINLLDKLFGGNGSELLGMFEKGSEGIRQLSRDAEGMGLVLSKADAKKALDAAKAFSDLKNASKALASEIDIYLAPTLTKLAEKVTNVIRKANESEEYKEIFKGFVTKREIAPVEEMERAVYLAGQEIKRIEEEIARLQKVTGQASHTAKKQIKDLEYYDLAIAKTKLQLAEKGLADAIERENKAIETQIRLQETVSAGLAAWDKTYANFQKRLKSALETGKRASAAIESLNGKIANIEVKNDPYAALNYELEQISENAKRGGYALNEEFKAAFANYEQLRKAEIGADMAKQNEDAAKKIQDYNTRFDEMIYRTKYAGDATKLFALEIANMRKEMEEAGLSAEKIEENIEKYADTMKKAGDPGFVESISKSINDYAESLPSLGESIGDMVKSSMDGMTEAVAEFAASGKFSFKDFTGSVIKDLTRIAVQQAILKPLLNGLFSGGGGGGGVDIHGNTAHTGGIVGQLSGAKKEVSPLVFADAPRFHSGGVLGGGLGAGEYPIIAKRGEGIFTPEQMRALSPSQPPQVNVNVQNNTSSKVTVRQSYNGNGGVDIDARIESAMTAAAANRSSNFNQALGASRRLVRR